MLMDSNRSSPYRGMTSNHISRQSHPSQGYLDPIILYNPKSVHQSTPALQTKSTFRNTHRRKIFDSNLLKQQTPFQTPIEATPNKQTQIIVQKLNHIENKITQIEGFIDHREQLSQQHKEDIQLTINSRMKQKETQLNNQQGNKKLLKIIHQKQQCRKQIDKLKKILQTKDRKINEIKQMQKQKQIQLNNNLQVQLLAYERDRSWMEYQRIKHGITKRQDYHNEIQKIKKRVERQYQRNTKSQYHSNHSHQQESSQSFAINKFIPKNKRVQKESVLLTHQLSEKHSQIVQANIPGSAILNNPELEITQSEVYLFDQDSRLKLVEFDN